MRHLAGMAAGCVAVAVVLTLLLLLLLQALLGICSGMRRLLGQPGAVVACWRRVAFDARSRADGVDPEVEQQVREHLSDRRRLGPRASSELGARALVRAEVEVQSENEGG